MPCRRRLYMRRCRYCEQPDAVHGNILWGLGMEEKRTGLCHMTGRPADEEKGMGIKMIEIIEKKKGNTVTNKMRLEFAALSNNESFARMAVAAFITPLNPTLEEMSDVKTAISEAVTNAVLHGYENRNSLEDRICMECMLRGDVLEVEIADRVIGIEDVRLAMEPLYTSKPDQDRSGMGFAFMEAFMDNLEVESEMGCGTLVRMCKKIGISSWIDSEE